MTRRRAFALLPLLVLGLSLLAPVRPVSAHANPSRSAPVAGSPNPVAPTEVRLFFTEQLELRSSEIKVYDPNRQEYSQGAVRAIAGDPLAMSVAVRTLPEGFYTVVWRANSAEDGHTTAGSFAFAVGSTPPPAASTFGDIPGETEFAPPTPAEIVTKWLAILAATTVVGALGLRLLVWVPTLRATEQDEAAPGGDADRRVVRRLVALVGAALIILTGATVVGLILQAAKVTNRSPLAALDSAILTDFLFNTRTGAIWSARLLLPVVALMLLAPLLGTALRGERRATVADDEEAEMSAVAPTGPLLLGLACGVAYLLTISLISHAAAAPFWVPFTIALDFLHLLGTAVWVGGLFGLVLTAPLIRSFGEATRPVLAGVVVRFSQLATISVVVLAATGTYSAWLHVGSLDALLQTDYGRSLTIKLVLFGALVALGAFNHFWLRPRLVAPLPKGGGKRAAAVAERARTLPLFGRLFGRTVRIEAFLGVAIILAVAFLTGFVPAREAIIDARAPKRAQTLTVGDLKVTLTLAALQPGDNNFDVKLEGADGRPVTNAERVALRLTHPEMDMGESEALATSRGDGHYTATGPYLSMSGRWDIRVIVRRANTADFDQIFVYPIGSTANVAATEGQLTAPRLPRLNSPRGLGIVAVGLGLAFAYLGVNLFRRGSTFGTILLVLVPTALVVGGYLIYTGEPNEVVLTRPVEPENPSVVDAASIARGQAIFASNCVVCHGAAGRGDGPQATTLNPRPPDMTQPHTAYHRDGYLFNAIRDGFPGSAMPAWGNTFTDPEKWDLVNYIRQFNRLTANGATPPAFASLPTATPPLTTPDSGTAVPARPSATPGTPAGNAPAPATATRAANAAPAGEGKLIHAFNGAIWAFDPAGGAPTNLTPTLSTDAFAGDPALSPDGTTIAYTVVVVPAAPATPTTAPIPLPGSDLWLMNRDGSNARRIYVHDKPGVLIQSPIWSADGKTLLYSYTAPQVASDGRYVGTTKEIQRLDPLTGTTTRVVENAQDPAVSVAGGATPFAYVQVDPQTFLPTLWVAGADGRGGREIVGNKAQFLTISGPRFSPDGKSLVFAASGGTASAAPPAAREQGWPERLARWFAEPFSPRSAAAHGPPADLWLLALDSGTMTRLTTLNGDDPLPAWSPDGRRLAFITGAGLYLLDLDAPRPVGATSAGLKKISDKGAYSVLVWATR